MTVTNQKEMSREILEYYRDIYEGTHHSGSPAEYLADQLQIQNEKLIMLESGITLQELSVSLHSSADSAPGPDGLPYSVYKRFWHLLGPLLLECWEYRLLLGELSPDQRYSVITLIPKPGKDQSKINNL